MQIRIIGDRCKSSGFSYTLCSEFSNNPIDLLWMIGRPVSAEIDSVRGDISERWIGDRGGGEYDRKN
jgi:hypothetical protein